jgi:hypothetical protein
MGIMRSRYEGSFSPASPARRSSLGRTGMSSDRDRVVSAKGVKLFPGPLNCTAKLDPDRGSQVRPGLAAGGRWIRTLGPPSERLRESEGVDLSQTASAEGSNRAVPAKHGGVHLEFVAKGCAVLGERGIPAHTARLSAAPARSLEARVQAPTRCSGSGGSIR